MHFFKKEEGEAAEDSIHNENSIYVQHKVYNTTHTDLSILIFQHIIKRVRRNFLVLLSHTWKLN